ncbi:ABC transporter substrate-binding protein [Paenibacillus sp. GYB003]|uniref:ABC transporter substrate-binding protein n=1 Tax=Paenibacillus sp. GYB003 TaxID=2994392 RepID=UPI002F96BFE3
MKNGKTMLLVGLASSLALAGCSGGKETAATPDGGAPAKQEPVTIRIYLWDPVNEDLFQSVFAEPVRKKYPHITLEPITRGKDTQPETLAVGGSGADIIMAWNSVLPQFTNLKLLSDITPKLKTEQIDLNRFDPLIVDGLRDNDNKSILYGLPFGVDFYATFYNKDIFDKFGVPYPKDGMYWEDAIELAKKLTRTEAGVQYKGLDPEGIEKLGNPLSLQFVDPKTSKASVNTDQWKKVFELAKTIYAIPGNENTISNHAGTVARFVKDKNVAMYPSHGVLGGLAQSDLNWDVVQYPSYRERPNAYGMVQAYALCITTNSANPDQALKVIQVLTSDDVQMAYTKKAAVLSPLKNPELHKYFGADMPILKGKNVEGILKSKPAPFAAQSVYSGNVRVVLEKKFAEYMKGKDLNTALREAEEEGNKGIEASKGAAK